jgi:hypothetical protein
MNKNPFKVFHKPDFNKKILAANLESEFLECLNCKKTFVKNNRRQIVYFCGAACRKEYRGKHGGV